MPERWAVLYDQATFADAAAEHVLFQAGEGSSSTKTKSVTNFPGSGALPSGYIFEIQKISVFADEDFALAERETMWEQSYLELEVDNQEMFSCPLRLVADRNAFGGHYSETTASDEAMIGLVGDGYMLPIPVTVQGGQNVRVNIYQGVAGTASMEVKCCLHGILSTP